MGACHVNGIADWYTGVHNPPGKYCGHEAVWPLWTFPMVFCGYSIILLFISRQLVMRYLTKGKGRRAFYFSLYIYPGFALIQAALGGLLYYSFPYLLISLFAFLVFFGDMDFSTLKSNQQPRRVFHFILVNLGGCLGSSSIVFFYRANFLYLLATCLGSISFCCIIM